MDDCEGRTGYRDWGHAYAKPEPGHEKAEDHLCHKCRAAMVEANATIPSTWEMFAEQKDDHFEHFYPSTIQVRMCGEGFGNKRPIPIFLVKLTRDEKGPYWGWLASHHPYNRDRGGSVSMVYRNRMSVDICFPYGVDSAIKRGHGEVIRVRAEIIRPAEDSEGLTK